MIIVFHLSGAERTADATELMYARQKIVMVAKAFRLQAIDMVHVNIHGNAIKKRF